jgi:hypothetical protein
VRKVDDWEHAKGEFSPLPGIGCLAAQVKLCSRVG